MSIRIEQAPELLAPAGGPSALRAAVAAGADAIYLGLDTFNARRSAENFTLETLPQACRFAHLHGRRVYLTANVLILPEELSQALSLVDAAWAAGVDAVIVQDLGLLRAIRQALPQVRVHSSTQMNAHSADTITALADMGVSRITLARETSLSEIGALAEHGAKLGVEVESFVHGALCVCYSGQCLLSSLIGGRSANRGRCAQPCRLPYELVDEAGQVFGAPGAHLLSPKDLAGITVLPGYVATGVSALKIEGRMKSPEYVALVTGVYRAALDRAVAAPDAYEVRDGEMSVLSEAFSRGFTTAYLTGERGNEMMSYRRPNNRGVLVGRVAGFSDGRAVVSLDAPLDAEDTIEVWTSRGRFGQRAGAIRFGGGEHRSAPAGHKVEIVFDEPASTGDRVFRVRNAALETAAQRTFASETGPEVPVDVHVEMVIGERLKVTLATDHGCTGEAQGSLVEAARTKAVTSEDLIEHVGRFGGTPYRPRAWDIALSPDAGIGFSALHAVRRAAVESLDSRRLEPWSSRALSGARVPEAAAQPFRRRAVAIVASVATHEAAEACLEAGADEVHLPVWELPTSSEAIDPRIIPVLSRISHDAEQIVTLDRIPGPSAIAGTLGWLHASAGRGLQVQAHWSLNAANPLAAAQLAELGASQVWLSPELSSRAVAAVAHASPVPVGIGVAGRQELMVTEHCILMSEGDCAQRCETCARRRGTRLLKDRKGYRFPVVTDPTGRTHVYNSVPLDLTASIDEVLATGIAAVRLDLETEHPAQAASEVRRIRAAIILSEQGKDVPKPDGQVTSGHFFRGLS